MAEGHGYKKAPLEDLSIVNLNLQLKLDVKIKNKTLSKARSCLFSFTLCRVNDQKVEFLNTVNDLKKKQYQRNKIEKKIYIFQFFGLSLYIFKKNWRKDEPCNMIETRILRSVKSM